MNTPEKIANLYLRLNGFFTMPHFTTLGEEEHRHTDILAVRLPGSAEQVGDAVLQVDKCFFDVLGRTTDETIPLVAEVKGGRGKVGDRDKLVGYLKTMFGDYRNNLSLVTFVKSAQTASLNDWKQYSLARCAGFIFRRLDSTQEMTDKVSGFGKVASWSWSEDFLSDLLYLKSLGMLSERPSSQD